MIGNVLKFLKTRLNLHLKSLSGVDEASEDIVVFPNGNQSDSFVFKKGVITILMINTEEETTLRDADPYRRVGVNGTPQKINPEIRLNLYVLFVANHVLYEDSLRDLSRIIQYFQTWRVIDHHSAPDLSENIEKLVLELVTLPFAEQNEVWNSLRVAYHPSVLYKVRMIVFRDQDAAEIREVDETILRTSSR